MLAGWALAASLAPGGIASVRLGVAVFCAVWLALLFWPSAVLLGRTRWWFWTVLRRCLWISTRQDVPFAEVLIADALTSLSKSIVEIEVIGCVLLPLMASAPPASGALLDAVQVGCVSSMVQPLMGSIPFLIRARQCMISDTFARRPNTAMEWTAASPAGTEVHAASADGAGGADSLTTTWFWPYRHLFNTAKYLTSLPVIWLSAYEMAFPGSAELRTAWLLAVTVNSLYSFAWDVIMDWGLGRRNSRHWRLRARLLYGSAWPYYALVFVNFGMRIVWSLKLSPHWHLSGSELAFLFEVCETLRRSMWNFVRVEWECVRLGLLPEADSLPAYVDRLAGRDATSAVVGVPTVAPASVVQSSRESLARTDDGFAVSPDTAQGATMGAPFATQAPHVHRKPVTAA